MTERPDDPQGPAGVSTRENAGLQRICRSALSASFPSFRSVEISAGFYPYIGLTHTIRRRHGRWVLRISDHCRNAPAAVLEAVAVMLACKVLRRKPPRRAVEVYDLFKRNQDVIRAVRTRRLKRGRKRMGSPVGECYSLGEIYRDVNLRHFNGQAEILKLGWGTRRSWGRLGHYDPVHNTITVSPVLDSPAVPRSVVYYLVYHEMLHSLFDQTPPSGAGRHHPPEFRKADRAFPGYPAIKKFLDEFCRNRGQHKKLKR